MKIAKQYVISGRVQGVGLRFFAERVDGIIASFLGFGRKIREAGG